MKQLWKSRQIKQNWKW